MRDNVIAGFQNPAVSGFYILAMILLCMHLYHGLWSMFQSLGFSHPRYTPILKKGAAIFAILIAIGNCSIPIAVMAGLLTYERDASMQLDSKSPTGPIETRWDRHRFNLKLVNPANKRKYTIIVVGSGLAGGSRRGDAWPNSATTSKCFCFQDSPAARAHHRGAGRHQRRQELSQRRRQRLPPLLRHREGRRFPRARSPTSTAWRRSASTSSISAWRRACRSRASTPGYLDNRCFGGAQVSRTFYARGQTGQQLLLGAYQALERQIGRGKVKMFPRTEMLDLIVIDGRARGIVTRNLITGKIESHVADAVVLGTGGYGNVFYLSTNAKGCNATAIWRAHKRGALFANPCFTQIHPTCIPVSGEYQIEAHPDERIAAQRRTRLGAAEERATSAPPSQIPEAERDYYLERKYPSFGNLVPRDVASRNAKAGLRRRPRRGRNRPGRLPGFPRRHRAPGQGASSKSATATCSTCTSASPAKIPTRCRCASIPAIHYTMGGLWVDYNLMSNSPACTSSARPTSPITAPTAWAPARSCRAWPTATSSCPTPSAIIWRPTNSKRWMRPTPPCARPKRNVHAITRKLLDTKGTRTVDSFHRELGKFMWEYCGMARTAEGLEDGAGANSATARAVLARREGARLPAKSSTSRSKRPAAWPISSSSPS